VWTTAVLVTADAVGAGILGMPVVVAKFGWLLGLLVISAMLAMNLHLAMVLWRVRMRFPSARTLGELVVAAFERAPGWQLWLASSFSVEPQMLSIFAYLGLYLLVAAKGLGMLFYDYRLCLPQCALVAGALILPIACSSRSMGGFRLLMWLNVLATCGAVGIPLVYLLAEGVEESRPEGNNIEAVATLTAEGVLSGLSTLNFATASQLIIVEIIDEMADPAEMPKAFLWISAPFQWAAFLATGVGGYIAVGSGAAGMIIRALPFGVPLRHAAACVAMHMLATYILKGVVLCRAAQEALFPSHGCRACLSWAAVCFGVMVVAYFVANAVPFFTEAVEFIGCTFTPLVCWVLPIASFLRLYRDAEDKPQVAKAELAVMFVELAIAVVVMIFGLVTALDGIFRLWSELGYPFDCHCEGIWDDCECSAQRHRLANDCSTAVP